MCLMLNQPSIRIAACLVAITWLGIQSYGSDVEGALRQTLEGRIHLLDLSKMPPGYEARFPRGEKDIYENSPVYLIYIDEVKRKSEHEFRLKAKRIVPFKTDQKEYFGTESGTYRIRYADQSSPAQSWLTLLPRILIPAREADTDWKSYWASHDPERESTRKREIMLGVDSKEMEVIPPKCIYCPPYYITENAATSKQPGDSVRLEVHIAANGSVVDVRTVSDETSELAKQFIHAFKRHFYEPASQDGVPVAIVKREEISFHP